MSFEEWLIELHAKNYVGLDDEMGENFEEWLEDKDSWEFIGLAELWYSSLKGGE